MSVSEYLDSEVLTDLVQYRSEAPQNAVAFVGTLRKHPYDENKCLLIADPAGCEPAIYEFRAQDILGAEELPSPVDETGQLRPLLRLWVKKGGYGIRYEPFEVDEPLRFPGESGRLRDKILKSARCWS
jgi:inorganic pyrophosphatase